MACWDDKNISLSGRATLVQSIMSAIPIYALSFYIQPKATLREMIRVQRSFLWGGDDTNSKIPWVSWEEVYKEKSIGGLGIRDVGVFNKALVRKWVGRFLEEKENLWVRVVESRYGSFGREGKGGGLTRTSLWWRDISRLFWGGNGEGLRRKFVKMVGNEENTSF